jgi:hypothetical protein
MNPFSSVLTPTSSKFKPKVYGFLPIEISTLSQLISDACPCCVSIAIYNLSIFLLIFLKAVDNLKSIPCFIYIF